MKSNITTWDYQKSAQSPLERGEDIEVLLLSSLSLVKTRVAAEKYYEVPGR